MHLLKIFFFIIVLQFGALSSSYGRGVVLDDPSTTPKIEIGEQLREALNSGSDTEVITLLLQTLETQEIDQIINELATKLTISDLEKLYALLIPHEQLEQLALKVEELRNQKEKIESAPLFDHPRIMTIAKSKDSPTEFWIWLTDGSFWEVDPSLLGGDDPSLQKNIINMILGNYVIKQDYFDNNNLYPSLFEIRDFPKAESGSHLSVKEMESVNLQDKDIYHLSIGGFFK